MRGLSGISMGYAAGAVGAVICSLVMWFCGEIGISNYYAVKIHPNLTLSWLYPRIVIGGLWGFAFTLPFMERSSQLVRGLAVSILPTLFQLFVIFPIFMNQGVMGTKLGEMTPFFVIALNAIWGMSAGFWLKLARA